MHLGLSSDAAPGAGAADLVAACARRGLSAVEITLGTAADPLEARAAAAGAAVTLRGMLSLGGRSVADLAELAQRASAPVVVGGDAPLAERIRTAQAIIDLHGAARVLVTGNAGSWTEEVARAHVPFAWQIDGSCDDPAGDAALIPQHAGRVEYVRLVGGGPETAVQEGRGVGAVMRTLALSGYDGPVILTPSSQRFRVAWSAWLGRRGGWGCGTVAERQAVIPLHP